MKIITNLSGIIGVVLLASGITGMITGFLSHTEYLLGSGLVVLGFVYLPLSIRMIYIQKKKIRQIIQSGYTKNVEDSVSTNTKSKTSSWGMNNSPFRERKSGLIWGGGNIKGSNATRSSRKKFLK